MEQNTETTELLSNQKKILSKLNTQHQLLLTAGDGEDKYDELKRQLGWDDTDSVIKSDYNKVLELQKITKENLDANILNNESIWNYCIKNNYVLVNIKQYKGPIPKELLEAIDNYAKSGGIKLDSDYNVGNLYILCRFSDVGGDNNASIKKSKRYKKGELPKVLLFERQVKGNGYREDHYKLIFELGYKTPIKNFINSLFFTHTKTLNLLHNILALGGVVTAIHIIGIFVTWSGKTVSPNYISWVFEVIPFCILILTGIFILKAILPVILESGDAPSAPSVNHHNDDNYDKIDRDPVSVEWCSTSYMYDNNQDFNIFDKNKVRLRVHIGFYIMILVFFLFETGLNRFNKILLFNKEPMFYSVYEDKEELTKTTTTYRRTGYFTYDEKKEIFDMAEQKRLEKERQDAKMKEVRDKLKKYAKYVKDKVK